MYFSKFPVIEYRNLNDAQRDQTRKIARDIVRRIAFSKRLKSEAGIYTPYFVQEGERPEHVALKVYGTEDYHWVVLLFNDAINPYYDWPLSESAITSYVDKKYPGDVLYCTSLTVSTSGATSDGDNFSGLTHAANETIYKWNGSTDAFGRPILNTADRALVWDFDAKKGALEVINMVGEFSAGDIVVKPITSDTYQYSFVQKVIGNKNGVHHFEIEGATTGEEQWVDPLVSLEEIPIGQTGAGPTNGPKTIGGTGSGSNVTTPVAYTDTMIARYTGAGPANTGTITNSISNNDYERRTNDRKREIQLLDPRYIEQVLTEFETEITRGNNRTIFNAPPKRFKKSNNY